MATTSHTPPAARDLNPLHLPHFYSKTEAHREANSLEGGGAVCPSPAHSCQASRAQSGAWARVPPSPQFCQSVILTGALVLNNLWCLMVKMKVTMALWFICGVMISWSNSWSNAMGVGFQSFSWLPLCVWRFISCFVVFQCNADKGGRHFWTGFLPKGYEQAETVPYLDYFLVQGWGAHLQECQAVEVLSGQKPQKHPHKTHSCLIIFFSWAPEQQDFSWAFDCNGKREQDSSKKTRNPSINWNPGMWLPITHHYSSEIDNILWWHLQEIKKWSVAWNTCLPRGVSNLLKTIHHLFVLFLSHPCPAGSSPGWGSTWAPPAACSVYNSPDLAWPIPHCSVQSPRETWPLHCGAEVPHSHLMMWLLLNIEVSMETKKRGPRERISACFVVLLKDSAVISWHWLPRRLLDWLVNMYFSGAQQNNIPCNVSHSIRKTEVLENVISSLFLLEGLHYHYYKKSASEIVNTFK